MTTLDDRLLGEKLQNYCSSSEDEGVDDEDVKSSGPKGPKFTPAAEIQEQENWSGTAQNTGPKGVIRDWQRYKQLENDKSIENEIERKNLIKKLSLTCKTDLEEKEMDLKQQQQKQSITEEDEDLMNDPFFEQYLKQTFKDMQKKMVNLPKFGYLIELSTESYIKEIDDEKQNVTVIIHIYDNRIAECRTMNQCLQSLALDYEYVKFCKVNSSEISLTEKFRKMGCPALLVYKNGELIGNFVRLGDEFGQEFYASDVESFLTEHGLLPANMKNPTIRSKSINNDSDTD